jgi:adenylate cyclase
MPETPNTPPANRKLAAIMFTDIVGYTSLMQKDEKKGLLTIERHRSVMEHFTQKYHGEILHYYGDGSLGIFPSAAEAVECAVEVQKEFAGEPAVPLRIGIHLGDVVQQGKAVFGDGVNVASRIQALGIAGSILITDAIYHLITNQSEVVTVPLGKFSLRNVDYPVPVYALKGDCLSVPTREHLLNSSSTPVKKSKWSTALIVAVITVLAGFATGMFFFGGNSRIEIRDKSIAVLPFDNLSNDPQQDYFSEGMTDDIINHLVKISALKVKSGISTGQYKNSDKSLAAIGSELGVSYILEGSVRKADNKIRVVAKLIDAANDLNIWTDTFDREITEIFGIQSEIAIEIAKVLEATLTSEERRYIRDMPHRAGAPEHLSAYDLELRARGIWRNWNDEGDLRAAIRMLDRAIELDSTYARSYLTLGKILHHGLRHFGVSTDVWIEEALKMADRAIAYDSTLAEAFLLRGRIYRNQEGMRAEAKRNLQQAYRIEPGNAEVLQSLGNVLLSHGEYEKGAAMILQSIERGYSVSDPEYYVQLGDIHLRMMEDFDRGEELILKARSMAPGWIAPYLSLGHMYRYWGKPDKAEEILDEALKIAPENQVVLDLMGWVSLLKGNLNQAAGYWSRYEEIEAEFTDSSQYVPFRHRLGYVKYLQGDRDEAMRLMQEQLQLDLDRHRKLRGYGAWTEGGFYYDLAATYAFLGRKQEALAWLDSTYRMGFINLWYLQNDPLLESIRGEPEAERIAKELENRQKELRKAFEKAIEEIDGRPDSEGRDSPERPFWRRRPLSEAPEPTPAVLAAQYRAQLSFQIRR